MQVQATKLLQPTEVCGPRNMCCCKVGSCTAGLKPFKSHAVFLAHACSSHVRLSLHARQWQAQYTQLHVCGALCRRGYHSVAGCTKHTCVTYRAVLVLLCNLWVVF